MSLKVRLIAVLCAFVIVALAATDAITYTSFRSYAVGQLDQQLVRSANLVAQNLGFSNPFGGPRSDIANEVVTPGTLATELAPSGQRLLPWTSFGSTAQSSLILPASLAGLAATNAGGAPVYRTVPSTVGTSYRVLEASLNNGNVLAEAIPLAGTDAALHHLLALELLVSGAVLIALALAAWLIIRISLRPLQKMADTAGEIAAGDLSQRVEETDNRTEVGRLGRALNVMLGRIEIAFREREASEARLRRFVADASHELRTPLTSIRGYAELFQHGLADRPADLDTAMRRIDSESTRMAGLVDDLLLLARLDQGRPLEREPVDLTTLVADAAQDARAVDPSRTVTCEAPPECVIIGDEGRLRQLLGNLVSNALAYTPAGSPLEVIAMLEHLHGPTRSRAKVLVVDHGDGITPEAAPHVFERFWRSDPARVRAHGGAGLGLSIVAAIADAHGGHVALEDTPGGGATFVVELPTEPEPGPSPWGAHPMPGRELTANGAGAADGSSFVAGTASGDATGLTGPPRPY
ncbi:MAG: HAMP domain-containing sensor histidine kinase [Acidimicrobiales bacterium]